MNEKSPFDAAHNKTQTSTEEFEAVIINLGLGTGIVKRLNDTNSVKFYHSLLDHFVEGGDCKWWWEAFKSSFRINTDGFTLDHLNRIIPDLSRKVWLMIEDNYKSHYPIYDIQARVIAPILSECAPEFEYYIIRKDLDWLICEAHTGNVFGVGEQLEAHLSLLNL